MSGVIYLDTHVVAWLYAGKLKLIPINIQNEIANADLLISPIVTLELEYLFEIGRVSVKGLEVVHDLETRPGLKTCKLPFDSVIKQAIEQRWTRDPFDRIIVSQASMRSSKLVTKDDIIHKNYKHTLW
jgi:PIN domain nuclease of toxin-antitoxin system